MQIHSKPLYYNVMYCMTSIVISCLNDLGSILFKTIFSTAYLCLFENNELLSVQMKDIKLIYDKDCLPYYQLTITERKVSSSEPKLFMIYNNFLEPEIKDFTS